MAARLIAVYIVAAGAAAQSDRATFETVCGACHSTSLISDLKSRPEWEETVDWMVDRGAKAGPPERAAIMRFLSRNFTRINVNSAPVAEIAEVLDMPSETARKIVAGRPYKSFEDLQKRGSAPAEKLAALKARIAFK